MDILNGDSEKRKAKGKKKCIIKKILLLKITKSACLTIKSY